MCVSESGRAVAAKYLADGDRSVANTRQLSSWWGNICLLLVLNSLSNYISSHTFIFILVAVFLHAEFAPISVWFFFSFIFFDLYFLRICYFIIEICFCSPLFLSIVLSRFAFSFFPKKRHSQIRDTCVFHERNRRTVPKIDTRIRK